jgi:Pyruvate/2-oxoacid:ferredoxin oxidoreductase delta subunit
MNLKRLFSHDQIRRQTLAVGQVVPETARCVQCGICSFYCPISIDVRRHAWLGKPVQDSHCLTCGECVARCPRGVLRFEMIELLNPDG